MKPLRIGMTYDLRADYLAEGYTREDVAEFDSEETIGSLEGAIRAVGHHVDRIGHARALIGRLVGRQGWDLVFNIAEGLAGRNREAQVPCILELYGIGYTFSDPMVCAATLDKAVAKRLVRDAGLPTARFSVVRREDDIATIRLDYPLFAKPLAEGTGKGIDDRSRIDTPEHLARICDDLLKRFRQPVLVEEFLPGREFTVGLLGTGSEARVLGTMEISLRGGSQEGIYSYDSKEQCERLVEYSPPQPGRLIQQVEQVALEAHRALECRDASRVDIRLDRNGAPCFMEVNPLPGLHPTHSDLPMIATQEGMKYPDLIGAIIASAWKRWEQSGRRP
jgi:D-alanine-D-alanine ligase